MHEISAVDAGRWRVVRAPCIRGGRRRVKTIVLTTCFVPRFAGITSCTRLIPARDDSKTPRIPKMTPEQEMERREEAALLARVAAGDHAAFAQFYDRLAPRLYALALKMLADSKEAEDVCQETFVYMWRKAFTYDSGRSGAFTWAVMIVRNKGIDRIRARQRLTRLVEQAVSEAVPNEGADDRSADEPALREGRAEVRSALERIPAEQRQAVELAFFSGMTHEQIAEHLGAPLGTIKARIRRGLLRLRDCLKGEA